MPIKRKRDKSQNIKTSNKKIKRAEHRAEELSTPIDRKLHLVARNPNSYAKISLIFKHKQEDQLEENEFQFILASAVQSLHGDIANQVDILNFQPAGFRDNKEYHSIIKFKTDHLVRVKTGLLLFGSWKKRLDCKFEIHKVAQTPCFLSI